MDTEAKMLWIRRQKRHGFGGKNAMNTEAIMEELQHVERLICVWLRTTMIF